MNILKIIDNFLVKILKIDTSINAQEIIQEGDNIYVIVADNISRFKIKISIKEFMNYYIERLTPKNKKQFEKSLSLVLGKNMNITIDG